MATKEKLLYWLKTILLVAAFPFALNLSISICTRLSLRTDQIALVVISLCTGMIIITSTKILQVTYILFHELTHSLFTLISSGKVYKFKITRDFGYIKADKNNFFIRLSPYFFPLLPFLIVALFYPLIIFIRFNVPQREEMVFLIFLSLFSFFSLSTIWYNLKLLKLETTDISPSEILLSTVFIADIVIPIFISMLYALTEYRGILSIVLQTG